MRCLHNRMSYNLLNSDFKFEYCTLHEFQKAVYLRNSMEGHAIDKVLMCDLCRDKLFQMFGNKILKTLKIKRI